MGKRPRVKFPMQKAVIFTACFSLDYLCRKTRAKIFTFEKPTSEVIAADLVYIYLLLLGCNYHPYPPETTSA